MVERLHGYARAAGRAPEAIGIEAWINVKDGTEAAWADRAAAWRRLGATHLCVNTMGAGLRSVQDHIEAVRRAHAVLAGGLVGTDPLRP